MESNDQTGIPVQATQLTSSGFPLLGIPETWESLWLQMGRTPRTPEAEPVPSSIKDQRQGEPKTIINDHHPCLMPALGTECVSSSHKKPLYSYKLLFNSTGLNKYNYITSLFKTLLRLSVVPRIRRKACVLLPFSAASLQPGPSPCSPHLGLPALFFLP